MELSHRIAAEWHQRNGGEVQGRKRSAQGQLPARRQQKEGINQSDGSTDEKDQGLSRINQKVLPKERAGSERTLKNNRSSKDSAKPKEQRLRVTQIKIKIEPTRAGGPRKQTKSDLKQLVKQSQRIVKQTEQRNIIRQKNRTQQNSPGKDLPSSYRVPGQTLSNSRGVPRNHGPRRRRRVSQSSQPISQKALRRQNQS